MHKYFAKTLFLGKKITFLPECHSTNDELMGLVKKNLAKEGDVLSTNYQIKGKGQRGNAWLSEPGENLLFSFVVSPHFLSLSRSHYLNIIAGLAVTNALTAVLPDQSVTLKWPNDVYVGDQKISGTLIETLLGSKNIEHAIIGIGLNVNQQNFYLQSATSLFLSSGKKYDRDELLESILVNFEALYLILRSGDFNKILNKYYEVMRWRGEIHYFKSGESTFSAEIIGIDDSGRLVVKTNNLTRRFDVKEIEFLY